MQRFNFKEFLQRFVDEPEKTEFLSMEKGLPLATVDGPWIAGGALRRTLINQKNDADIDYFFKNEQQMLEFCDEMSELEFVESNRTENCITFVGNPSIAYDKENEREVKTKEQIKVQAIIIGYYDNLEDVIDSFDFTITQLGYDGKDLVCGDFTLWDLARKRLAIHKLTYGVSTLRRLIKYSRQGFTACGGVLADMLQKTLEDPQTASSEVMYVD